VTLMFRTEVDGADCPPPALLFPFGPCPLFTEGSRHPANACLQQKPVSSRISVNQRNPSPPNLNTPVSVAVLFARWTPTCKLIHLQRAAVQRQVPLSNPNHRRGFAPPMITVLPGYPRCRRVKKEIHVRLKQRGKRVVACSRTPIVHVVTRSSGPFVPRKRLRGLRATKAG